MRTIKNIILISSVLILGFSIQNFGQEKKAFSSLDIFGKIVYVESDSRINEFWTTQFGADVGLSTPFYAGLVDIGLSFIPYSNKDESVSKFNTFFIYFGWGMEIQLLNRLKFLVGAKIGITNFVFENSELNDFNKNESELSLAAYSRLSLLLVNRLNLVLGADYSKIFLKNEIKNLIVSAGFSYTFDTSQWFKDIVE